MANRPQQLTLPPPRTYSRTEFAALRARVQGVPLPAIARLYFDSDTTPYADEPGELDSFLRTMRDDLVQLAILHGSSVLADHLRASIARHGSARLTTVSLQMVGQAAQLAVATPAAGHAVGSWFRPLIASRLTQVDIHTLGDLVAYANRRGGSWWRSVPRIGLSRARIIVRWLRQHANSIGMTIAADVEAADPLAAPGAAVMLEPARQQLAPLERLALPGALSGAEGTNRATVFPYVSARHDLEAIRAYLHLYDGQDATQRAYRRELERLVLWAVVERGVALSSMTVEDCTAYKHFLAAPSDAFTGPPASRASGRWRPFAPRGLSLDSQRYAVRALRAAFAWLVDVRYLAGNPWKAVRDPKPVTRATRMKVDRALPINLWSRLRTFLADCGEGLGPMGPDWRAARALILLMGDTGLRIAEATAAGRQGLMWLPADGELPPTWLLTVIGKGSRERHVPVGAECVDAIRAHWCDRGLDFDAPDAAVPLVAPIVIPPTPAARAKFGESTEHTGPAGAAGGYSVRGARRVVTRALRRIIDTLPDLAEAERQQLARTSPHAFRHTFGTQSTAADMPLDVVQRILGHASMQTTSIYVTAEQKRMRGEAAKYHAQLSAMGVRASSPGGQQ